MTLERRRLFIFVSVSLGWLVWLMAAYTESLARSVIVYMLQDGKPQVVISSGDVKQRLKIGRSEHLRLFGKPKIAVKFSSSSNQVPLDY